MSFYKNGIINSSLICESIGEDVLNNSYKYLAPYSVTGTSGDIIVTTDMYGEVTPSTTYYLIAQCPTGWSDGHGYSASRAGKGTIWLYMSKTYNASSTSYDTPVLFTSSNWIREGVWTYTVPADYHMARIRLNTYSDGSTSVTAKFCNIHLIEAKYYVDGIINSLKVGNDYTSANEIVEY